jgi:threonine dehydrogenase-like Zn-dependent dehydrogenase
MRFCPIGKAMGKNLTVKMGNCNHRKYIPLLLDWVKEGSFDPLPFITQKLPFDDIINGYKHFDKRDDNWIKVILTLGQQPSH